PGTAGASPAREGRIREGSTASPRASARRRRANSSGPDDGAGAGGRCMGRPDGGAGLAAREALRGPVFLAALRLSGTFCPPAAFARAVAAFGRGAAFLAAASAAADFF